MFFRRRAPKAEQLKIVIIGAGEVGFHVAQRLAEEHKQVVVIDQHADALRRLEESLDVQTVLGSGASPSVLHEAGAASADILLAATDSDEINIVACLFAGAIAPHAVKLARVRNAEYSAYINMLADPVLNISKLVNPEEEIVRTIDRVLTLPGAIEYGEFADRRIRMVSLHVEEGPLVGQPLTRFRQIVGDDGIMVGGIGRGDTLIVPSGTDEILAGDVVYFVYKSTSLRTLLAALRRERDMIGTVCIVGGGNIGERLAALFEKKGIAVKLIDKNPARCEVLADALDKTLILHGDGTDKALLLEENIHKTDAFIAVSSDEETNIISCLLAKSLGVKKTVARVNKAAYLPLVESIGITHSVSPRISAVNSILQYIRQGNVLTSFSVGGDAAEVLEVLLTAESPLAGGEVQSLNLPRGVLMLAVLRGEEAFIPTGRTVLAANDHIVLLALRRVMPEVENLLAARRMEP